MEIIDKRLILSVKPNKSFISIGRCSIFGSRFKNLLVLNLHICLIYTLDLHICLMYTLNLQICLIHTLIYTPNLHIYLIYTFA